MKKILFLTHLFPYPPNDGGRIVTFNTLKGLVKYGHDVTLCSFIGSNEKIHENLLSIVSKVHVVKIDYNNSISGLIKNLFSPLPYNMYKYVNKEMEKLIRSLLVKENFDIIYIDHLHMAYYIKKFRRVLPTIKKVLREHNVESQIMFRVYKNEKNIFKKYFFWYQYLKLYNYEKNIINLFDKIYMITEEDKDLILSMNSSHENIYCLPAGVDTNKYYPMEIKMYDRPTILFLGTMSWLPNIDAVDWFLKEMFDEIVKKIPNILFLIVGKNPPQYITELAEKNDNIIVTGFVDDERPYIASADLVIVPLRIGGGMRIKILNTLAMRKTVISTKIGAEGIKLSESDIVIANTRQEFIDSIVNLIHDQKLNQLYASNGYNTIIENYSNDKILFKHAQELDNL